MTDFDIKSTLECVPSKTFIEVDFRNSGGYPIHVRFTDKDVSVIGDYCCWVFKGNIVNYPRPKGRELARLPQFP